VGYLVGVTVLWAFSFSLIGVYLAGQVDSYFAVAMRVVLAALVFLPFLRPGLLRGRQRLALMGLGAVQLGVMYIFFYQSFLLLSVPEVLLFTIFTPLYITLLDDALFGRFTPFYLLTAALAVLGAGVIRYDGLDSGFLLGFLVVQGANLCFALGRWAIGASRRSSPTRCRATASSPGSTWGRWSSPCRPSPCWATPVRCPPPGCSGACCCGWGWWPPGWATSCGTWVPPGSMPGRWRS